MTGSPDSNEASGEFAASARPACRRFRVTGRVQGVFFRDSTRRVALELGLSGYARNEPDGSVEVLACGSAAALEQLANWLHKGPKLAVVERVHIEPVDPGSDAARTHGFTTG